MAASDRSVRLTRRAYGRLEAEARRRGRSLDSLADELLSERLASANPSNGDLAETLERAARLRARVASTVDAATVVREGREQLEQPGE
jgi:hypothetical protein